MATYAVSFDLKYDDTYSDRYKSLMDAIRNNSTKMWNETTSFVLAESSSPLENFERSLYLSSFTASKDILLVINVTGDNAIGRGAIKNKTTLKELLPKIEVK